MHILLHADVTIVLSTDLASFTTKGNVMLDYFKENKLKLNIGKSGFMCIGGGANNKNNVELSNGVLK